MCACVRVQCLSASVSLNLFLSVCMSTHIESELLPIGVCHVADILFHQALAPFPYTHTHTHIGGICILLILSNASLNDANIQSSFFALPDVHQQFTNIPHAHTYTHTPRSPSLCPSPPLSFSASLSSTADTCYLEKVTNADG